MKALVKRNSEPGLWLEDVEMPAVGINDVLIKVFRTGICGTDLHIWQWDEWSRAEIHRSLIARVLHNKRATPLALVRWHRWRGRT